MLFLPNYSNLINYIKSILKAVILRSISFGLIGKLLMIIYFRKSLLLNIDLIYLNQNYAFPGVLGKQETSRMFSIPVVIITSLSNPSPNPP